MSVDGKSKGNRSVDLTDPDSPEWTEGMQAVSRPAGEMHPPQIAAQLVRRRGRPSGSTAAVTKEKVTLRLDPDILAHFRASGKGWQTRLNDALRRALF